jgi:quinone-modifying oxidoreductase subunit QmoC
MAGRNCDQAGPAIHQSGHRRWDTVKQCYQCDTCSVVCNPTPIASLSPEDASSAVGLEGRGQDPDIWLCHHCSDCTVYCPRGAKPGEVMNVLRKLCIETYATPPILAQMVGDYKFLPLLIALPVLLLALALKITGHWGIPEGPIVYSHFFPTLLIDAIFVPAFFFAVAVLGKGVLTYWKDINRANPWRVKVGGNLVGNLIATLKDILMHNRFRECETTYNRSTNHLFLLFGFIFLAVVTSWGFLNEWVLHVESPYFLMSPYKMWPWWVPRLLYGIFNIIQGTSGQCGKGRGTAPL